MGQFKKIISSILVLLLVIIGAVLISVGLRSYLYYNLAIFMKFYEVQMAVLISGIILIFTAIFLLIDIVSQKDKDREILVDDEYGSVLITQKSLESTLRHAVNKFSDVDYIRGNVKVFEGSRIEAECYCDIFRDDRLDLYSHAIQKEIEKSLKEMTGISDIKANVYLNKTQRAAKKEIR